MTKKTGRNARKGLLHTTSLAGLAAVAAAFAALPAAAQDQEPAAEAEEEEDDDIVVTGTRIRSEFNSPSPLQVVTTDAALLAGASDAGDVIQNSSVALGSPQVDASISNAFVTDGGPGAQTISLRGLGANRTLVLLNGRRAGPAGTRGAVSAFDLNVIPVGVVDRFEILKDGASSIYGSDAVAGVVNIITRRDMDGGSATMSYSQPQDEGGEELGLELAWGHNFGNGYINVSANYYGIEMIRRNSRDYLGCGVDRIHNALTGEPTDAIDPRTGERACIDDIAWGQVWLYDYAYFYGQGTLNRGFGANYIQPDPGGVIGALFPGSVVAPANPFQAGVPDDWVQVGYNAATLGVVNLYHPVEQRAGFSPTVERATVYLDGAFDIGGGAELYGEVLLNRRESSLEGVRQVWTYLYSYDYNCSFALGCSPGGDPFNPGWTGLNTISPTVVVDWGDSSEQVDYMRAVAGLRGDFAGPLGSIDWDIFMQHSRSDSNYTSQIILQDAVYSSDGRSVNGSFGLIKPNSIPRDTASCVGFNTPISNRPCIDVNWVNQDLLLGNGFTDEEEDFLFETETGNTLYTQTYLEGMLSGDLFEMPAGNVGAAVGFHIRRDEIDDTPGPNAIIGNAWGSSASGATRGDDETREVFGELAIPLMRGAGSSLDATLSSRYTEVETSGEAVTYKLGLAWQASPEWLFRFTRGTSFRAPALFELYLGGETSFPRQSQIDPCINWTNALALEQISQEIADNCAFSGGPNPVGGIPGNYNGAGSSATAFRNGGLGLLEPETSEATVIGFVWTPQFANLSVSVDYFDITIEDEVATMGSNNIILGCYTSDSFPTDPLCTLFDRGIGPEGSEPAPPSNGAFLIETVSNAFLNINEQTNRGIDLSVRYLHELPFGDFTFQGQATWQLEDVIQLFSGTPVDLNGNNGDPEFVSNLDFQLESGDWTFFWRSTIIGPSSDISFAPQTSASGLTAYDIRVETTDYHAASVTRDFDNIRFTLGLANIFDTPPPGVTTRDAAQQATIGPSLFASQYDYLGRRAFVRLTANF